jgi:hypothetical protein
MDIISAKRTGLPNNRSGNEAQEQFWYLETKKITTDKYVQRLYS